MKSWAYTKTAFGFMAHAVWRRFFGYHKFKGSSKKICKQIIEKCWTGEYFTASCGHFKQFWMRDFGMFAKDLIDLGYFKKVKATTEFAFETYKNTEKVTTTIFPDGTVADVFDYAADSLPFLVHCLKLTRPDLIKSEFIKQQAEIYFDKILSKETGLVKQGVYFSSAKDNTYRSSSTYDNIMACWLAKMLEDERYEKMKKLIKKELWNGFYFYDSLGNETIAGDANVIPYWTGVFDDKKMLSKSTKAIQNAELDKPFPLKYTLEYDEKHEKLPAKIFAPNYQGNSIWAMWGMHFLKIANKSKYINKYLELVKKHKTFLEIYDPDGSPYKSLFYYSDEGMIWCAGLLNASKKHR